MKKLLLFLLLSGFSFGQNIELLKKALQTDDLVFTEEFTKEIYSGYQIIDSDNSRFKLTYVLLPVGFSLNELEDYKSHNGCSRCVNAIFEIRPMGGNSDLNIPSKNYYFFKEAKGSFLSMFPFWKKNIDIVASENKTYESRPVYTYKNKEDKIWFNFWRVESTWMMRNESERSSDDW